jgi:hypothetical protein
MVNRTVAEGLSILAKSRRRPRSIVDLRLFVLVRAEPPTWCGAITERLPIDSLREVCR